MSDQRLQEAVTLIKAGNVEFGQKLLIRLVRENPKNEKAWLWLVNTTPKRPNQIGCLERVIAINPEHQTAKKLLAELKGEPAEAAPSVSPPTPPSETTFEYVSVLPTAREKAQLDVAPGEVLPDPLMVEIEKERRLMEDAALQEAAEKAAQEAAAIKAAKIAKAALLHAEMEKEASATPSVANNRFAQPDPAPEKTAVQPVDGVYQFDVSLVISKARGALGLLFNSKNRMTRAVLKIAPKLGLLQIKGVDVLVQNDQYNLYFDDVRTIESPEPGFLTLKLHNGRNIQLKDVELLNDIIDLLAPSIVAGMKQTVVEQGKRPFEQRATQPA